jgi:NAD(P)-dependent dehydrogenase (short-subunit alcohol dehydrogenase family)
MLLEGKTAIVYGAAGAIGGAVARAFAREGASVFLAGRALAPVQAVAEEIAAGGAAEAASVDALDEQAVNQHAAAVATKAGRIDISFNAISLGDVQGTRLLDIPLADFSRPITTGTRTHLLTARAAARHMIERRAGVILTLTASAVRLPDPVMGPPVDGRLRRRLRRHRVADDEPGRGAGAARHSGRLPAVRRTSRNLAGRYPGGDTVRGPPTVPRPVGGQNLAPAAADVG